MGPAVSKPKSTPEPFCPNHQNNVPTHSPSLHRQPITQTKRLSKSEILADHLQCLSLQLQIGGQNLGEEHACIHHRFDVPQPAGIFQTRQIVTHGRGFHRAHWKEQRYNQLSLYLILA